VARLPQGQSKEIEKALKVTLPYIAIGHRNFWTALSCVSIAEKLNLGGLGGALQGHAMGDGLIGGYSYTDKQVLAIRTGSRMLSFGIEYAGQAHVKNDFSGLYTKDLRKKTLLSAYKSFLLSSILR
jgi:hypothetical protein